ncbi:MAG: Sec-independent protein translocase subunit TatB [Nocardioidaceae bacterium]|nr:Sec-independent protein translocase subunit TatB [Nocardioidaceae bacterium]
MFDVGLPEMLVLAILAIFVFGPDKLPDVARQAGRMLRQARTMLTNARSQLSDEFGPEIASMDLRDLSPRALVKKHLLDDLEEDDEPPQRPGHRPLELDEAAPYDEEAT